MWRRDLQEESFFFQSTISNDIQIVKGQATCRIDAISIDLKIKFPLDYLTELESDQSDR
jgi:hypothetical protein